MDALAVKSISGKPILDPITREPLVLKVVYVNGVFCVNESIGSATYDVTHIGVTSAALAYLSKENAIKLCNELADAGINAATSKELNKTKQMEQAYKIVAKYRRFSKIKTVRKAKQKG